MTRRRLVLLAGLIAGLLAGIAIGLGYWLLLTESGLRWSVRTAERASGGSFSVKRASGRMAGQVVLEDMRIDIPGFGLSVKTLRVRPMAAGLMRTTITIETAEAGDVEIYFDRDAFYRKSPAGSPSAEPFAFPMKIDVNIGSSSIMLLGSRPR